MKLKLIYDILGTTYESHYNKPFFDALFEAYGDAAVDLHMLVDQVNDSKSVATCPVYTEHTWLYREANDWDLTGCHHKHTSFVLTATGADAVYTYPYRLKNPQVFYNGRVLGVTDGVEILEDSVIFPYNPAIGTKISVYGEEIIRTAVTGTTVTLAYPIESLSSLLRFNYFNITSQCSVVASTLTSTTRFYANERLYVFDGVSSEYVVTTSPTNTVTLVNTYTNPTIHKILDFTIEVDEVYFDGEYLILGTPIAPGTQLRVVDAVGGETVTVTERAFKFKLSRVFDEDTADVLIYGGSIYDITFATDQVTFNYAFSSLASVEFYAEYFVTHSHYLYSLDNTTPITQVTLTTPMDPGQDIKVIVNGLLLDDVEYIVLSTTLIEFRNPGTGAAMTIPAGGRIRVFYVTSTAGRTHKHVYDNFIVQSTERAFTLSHRVNSDILTVESYFRGKQFDPQYTDKAGIIVYPDSVVAGSEVRVNGGAIEYPYYMDIDTDITKSYFEENSITESYIHKAEQLRDNVSGTAFEPWVDPDDLPVEAGFTIEKISEPSGIRVYSFSKYEEDLWFKDAYVVDYTLYNNFAVLLGLARANSEAYKQVVQAFYEGLWKGSQKYTIENQLNIIFGSSYTTTAGETITNRDDTYVYTNLSRYTIPSWADIRNKNYLPQHHALAKYISQVDPGIYTAFFGERYSDTYSIGNRLDNKEDSTLVGTCDSFASFTLIDTSTDFIDEEVWVGDWVYVKLDSVPVELFAPIVSITDNHTLVLSSTVDFLAYYTDPSVSTNIYRVYCRKTDELDEGGTLDRADNVSMINTALTPVMQHVNVYKLEWDAMISSEDEQKYAGLFLDKAVPAWASWEVYAEKDIQEVIDATIDEVPTLTLMRSWIVIGLSRVGGSAL